MLMLKTTACSLLILCSLALHGMEPETSTIKKTGIMQLSDILNLTLNYNNTTAIKIAQQRKIQVTDKDNEVLSKVEYNKELLIVNKMFSRFKDNEELAKLCTKENYDSYVQSLYKKKDVIPPGIYTLYGTSLKSYNNQATAQCLQFHTFEKEPNIFNFPIKEFKLDITYSGDINNTIKDFELDESTSTKYCGFNPGFKGHAGRIEELAINNATNSMSIENILRLKRS